MYMGDAGQPSGHLIGLAQAASASLPLGEVHLKYRPTK